MPCLGTAFGVADLGSLESPPCACRLASEGSGLLPGALVAAPGAGKNWIGIGCSRGGTVIILMIPSGSGSSESFFGGVFDGGITRMAITSSR
jgi:hypothetical protein